MLMDILTRTLVPAGFKGGNPILPGFLKLT